MGYFKRQTKEISHEIWIWQQRRNLKRETESLLIDHTVNHVTNEFIKLAQMKYKSKHDLFGKANHWELWKRLKSN